MGGHGDWNILSVCSWVGMGREVEVEQKLQHTRLCAPAKPHVTRLHSNPNPPIVIIIACCGCVVVFLGGRVVVWECDRIV